MIKKKVPGNDCTVFFGFDDCLFLKLVKKAKNQVFGQRPRRGRSPVEHRGTFVHPSVCPFVRSFVSPPQALSGLKSALSGLKSALSGLKSALSGLESAGEI